MVVVMVVELCTLVEVVFLVVVLLVVMVSGWVDVDVVVDRCMMWHTMME